MRLLIITRNMGIMKTLKFKKDNGEYLTADEKRFIEINEEDEKKKAAKRR